MNPSAYQILPSITECDSFLKQQGLAYGITVRERINLILNQVRQDIVQNNTDDIPVSKQQILEQISYQIQIKTKGTQRVINATGVVVHTNLGRAPLSEKLFQKVIPILCSYSTLEFDLESGKRGKRDSRVRELLKSLSGAEDAMVVNNNAAAVFLMLKTLNQNNSENIPTEVIVSRGELVEIGGSFRIPDIMLEAGVKLVEVGTTNRTRLSDYENAITKNTAALLKVHPSNYAIHGFTESVSVKNMAELAHSKGLLCFHDWGSGNFYQFRQKGLKEYGTAQQELAANPDILTFSGDKLLGSVQAGILLGKTSQIQKLRQHPLYRSLRLDKVTLGLLEATLEYYLDWQDLPENILTIGLLEMTQEEVRIKAELFLNQLDQPQDSGWEMMLIETESLTGGGALPELPLDSVALLISHSKLKAKFLQDWLRNQPVPAIVRIQDEGIRLDFRTILPEDNEFLLDSLNVMIQSLPAGVSIIGSDC